MICELVRQEYRRMRLSAREAFLDKRPPGLNHCCKAFTRFATVLLIGIFHYSITITHTAFDMELVGFSAESPHVSICTHP